MEAYGADAVRQLIWLCIVSVGRDKVLPLVRHSCGSRGAGHCSPPYTPPQNRAVWFASQGSHLLARRKAQAEIAGGSAVGTLEAQLKALQLSDVRAWAATEGCEDVTKRSWAALCVRVAEVKARIEAAKERDKLDVQIAALPAPKTIVGSEAPVVDPYVANVVALLKEAWFMPSERIPRASTMERFPQSRQL
jgi:hypothetical protein